MRLKIFGLGLLCICFALVCACGGGGSGDSGDSGVDSGGDTVVEKIPDILTPPLPSLVSDPVVVLMATKPDECVVEYLPYPSYYPNYYITRVSESSPSIIDGSCPYEEEIPKANEAYVWGLALAEDRLWFGTGANVQCLVEGGYLGIATPHILKSDDDYFQTCEFGSSWILDPLQGGIAPDLPDEAGDWRPPSINYYDLTNNSENYHMETFLDDTGTLRLNNTLGLRSAGAIGDVVFLAGPDFGSDGSRNVNVFAFKSSTAEYLGSYVLTDYSNIRKWKAINGHLYAVLTVSADIPWPTETTAMCSSGWVRRIILLWVLTARPPLPWLADCPAAAPNCANTATTAWPWPPGPAASMKKPTRPRV